MNIAPETDKEYMNRIAKEQKTIDQLEKQEEKDRREYERLKQKFGEK